MTQRSKFFSLLIPTLILCLFVFAITSVLAGTITGRVVQPVDSDGDGDLDLVVGDTLAVLLLDNGTSDPFDGVTGKNITSDSLDGTTSLSLGDVDGDGDLDLVVGRSNRINRLHRNN